MKVFVTGATGFIGRPLVKKLLDDGNEVFALVRRDDHKLPKEVRIVRGDILSPASWMDSGLGCQKLYHLAAMISFDPRQTEQLLLVNGTGTSNILKASLRWNIESTVVVSSACTMGILNSREGLLNEESFPGKEIVNNNPYLKSKLAAEKETYAFSNRRKVVIVNPTTVYGPGDWVLNSGTLIKKIATSRILPLPSGGSNVVDVEDVVEGVILAGELGVSGSRYIIGGQNLSFKDIFTEISNVVGNRPLFIPIPPLMHLPLSFTAGMIGRFTGGRFFTAQIVSDMFAFKYYSTERAEKHLGFKSRYSFKESVERAWSFYRANDLIR